ncbi:unnamed protein product, partial [Litomosoides sigmodontis]
KCNDITTRRAIEKRERQINLKCLENKEQLRKCENRTVVDIAWNNFEQANEEYFTEWNSCKKGKRKRRQYYDNYLDYNHNLQYPDYENRMKRHMRDFNDVRIHQKDENDYIKSFGRFKRDECLKSSEKEKTRLLEKFAETCNPDIIHDIDKMGETCNDSLDELSKARRKAYSNYLTHFLQCYGSSN